MCVCVHWKERESNHEQTVCGTSGSNLGENNSGGLFQSVTSSMPGKFHFNLLIFGCPVGVGGGGGGGGGVGGGGGGGGGGLWARARARVTNIIVVCVFLVLYGGSGS